MSWVDKLRNRWKMKHNYQVFLILVVFACTGVTVMLLKPFVVGLFIEPGEKSLLFSILYYVFILPIYNVILLMYGAVFGLFSFFWEFEKRTFRRIFPLKTK